jgi:hypothetical protein
MLLTAHLLQLPGGGRFLIETGAPMDGVQADLKKWVFFLAAMLPIVLGIGVGGGFVLVKRALLPVDVLPSVRNESVLRILASDCRWHRLGMNWNGFPLRSIA